jgi:hypothetical protein
MAAVYDHAWLSTAAWLLDVPTEGHRGAAKTTGLRDCEKPRHYDQRAKAMSTAS